MMQLAAKNDSQIELPGGCRVETRLMHVRANVRNLQEAIEWYSNTLGFKVRSHWPPDSPDYADFVSKEGAMFAVMEAEPVPAGARFNFDVNDVDALWERLKDAVEVVEPLFDTPYGTRKFTIRDLDGNELGFCRGTA
jgi:predicted enzyme related to lactoylglutathione lyase